MSEAAVVQKTNHLFRYKLKMKLKKLEGDNKKNQIKI